MIGKRTIRSVGLTILLAAMLIFTSLGCQPATSSAPLPNTNKTQQKPENKPNKQPTPDPG